MWMLALLFAAADLSLQAPSPCPATPIYSPCELTFELTPAETATHPNPYLTVELQGEFRSPRHRTFLMPAYWDGGRRMIIRVTPIDAGDWDYRITSNIARFNNQLGRFSATAAEVPGFIKAANVHHWATTENNQPHLWMGDTCYRFAFLDRPAFDRILDTRAKQKFNHIRGLLLGSDTDLPNAFPAPDRPNPDHFREADSRVLAMNRRGIVADLILGGGSNQLVKLLPTPQQRERYIRYIVARYSAMNVTWQLVQEFEEYENARPIMQEIGLALTKLDPYQHLRTTHTLATSAPLLPDGWMNYVVYQSSDDALGAIEHQLYPVPFVNAGFASEDSDAGAFRRRLWNATMDGQYPTSKFLDSPAAPQMTAWFDFFSGTRHWELEPYFDVDGGRAVALEGVEYIVYVEKPGPVEIVIEKHGYDIAWFNPASGESFQQKDFKGDRFTAEPPDKTHDWVLHISREGHKESMLRSYKFTSRLENPITLQEVEQSAQKVPFEIVEPARDELSLGQPIKFAARLKRETRATRRMMFLWTGEVAADGQGYRVLATGRQGEFRIPATLARNYPAVLNLRLAGINALGKVYFSDKVYRLVR